MKGAVVLSFFLWFLYVAAQVITMISEMFLWTDKYNN